MFTKYSKFKRTWESSLLKKKKITGIPFRARIPEAEPVTHSKSKCRAWVTPRRIALGAVIVGDMGGPRFYLASSVLCVSVQWHGETKANGSDVQSLAGIFAGIQVPRASLSRPEDSNYSCKLRWYRSTLHSGLLIFYATRGDPQVSEEREVYSPKCVCFVCVFFVFSKSSVFSINFPSSPMLILQTVFLLWIFAIPEF